MNKIWDWELLFHQLPGEEALQPFRNLGCSLGLLPRIGNCFSPLFPGVEVFQPLGNSRLEEEESILLEGDPGWDPGWDPDFGGLVLL